MSVLGKIQQTWMTGGGGYQQNHGHVKLVSGTAAIASGIKRVVSASLTLVGTTTAGGTAQVYFDHVVSTVNGDFSPTNGIVVVTGNDTSNVSTYSFILNGY